MEVSEKKAVELAEKILEVVDKCDVLERQVMDHAAVKFDADMVKMEIGVLRTEYSGVVNFQKKKFTNPE